MTVEAAETPPEEPKKRVIGRPFTKQTAKLCAMLANEARKAQAERPTLIALENRSNPLEALIVGQLERVSVALESDKLTPKERCELVSALDKLFDRLRILQDKPLPGSSRPVSPAKVETAASAMLGQQSAAASIQPGREDQD